MVLWAIKACEAGNDGKVRNNLIQFDKLLRLNFGDAAYFLGQE